MTSMLEDIRALNLSCPDCERPLIVEKCCARPDCTTFLLRCSCGGHGAASPGLHHIHWWSGGQEPPARWKSHD